MKSADSVVRRVRAELNRKGSSAVARSIQRFFKEPVPAFGWRTAAVRQLAGGLRKQLQEAGEGKLLFDVAERLFAAPTMEEKTLGVVLLERAVRRYGEAEFRRLERWLRHVKNWAACDALCTALLGPLVANASRRRRRVYFWARSRNPWYRRAAAVSLIEGAQRGGDAGEALRLAARLLTDKDEMVQKGVGWLLREASKGRYPGLVPFLLGVKRRAPRRALRTACEKLPARTRRRILG